MRKFNCLWFSAAVLVALAHAGEPRDFIKGRSPRELENLLAADVVYYYFAAEVRILREIACKDKSGGGVFRARELYHDCEDEPKEPFGDLWSSLEFGKAKWLAAMQKALE